MKHKVELFTDGACRGNPGPGGWGVLLRCGNEEKRLFGADANTTNNRMELMAVIEGLRALNKVCELQIVTDSQYVLKGVTEWMDNWKRKGWRTSANKPVKNADLWQMLDALLQDHVIQWHWVRGHTGHVENEIADGLANQAIDEWLQNH